MLLLESKTHPEYIQFLFSYEKNPNIFNLKNYPINMIVIACTISTQINFKRMLLLKLIYIKKKKKITIANMSFKKMSSKEV